MQKQPKVRKAVITVAGLGTRFLPVTKAVPKELIPILGKPVIHYLVKEMADSGIEEVVLVNSPFKKAINDYFKRDLAFEKEMKKKNKYDLIEELVEMQKKLKISFVYQKEPKGNGHALLQAKKLIGNEPFALSDGDSIIDGASPAIKQVIDVYNQLGATVIGVQQIKDKQAMTKYGNVYGKSKVKSQKSKIYDVEKIVEKPSIDNVSPDGLIIGGMRYIFTPDIWKILDKLPVGRAGEFWVADAANQLAQIKPFFAYVYDGTYYDTGSPETLLKTAIHFANK